MTEQNERLEREYSKLPHAVVAKKMKTSWMELWWFMAKGSQTEYERIKALDVFEFYTLRDLWEAEIKARNSITRQQNNKNNVK